METQFLVEECLLQYGNLLEENMLDLYKNSPILTDLQKQIIPEECKKCEHGELCKGGLKCLTYAIKKDYNLRDIGCDLEV